jgi:hypothetical protein
LLSECRSLIFTKTLSNESQQATYFTREVCSLCFDAA